MFYGRDLLEVHLGTGVAKKKNIMPFTRTRLMSPGHVLDLFNIELAIRKAEQGESNWLGRGTERKVREGESYSTL